MFNRSEIMRRAWVWAKQDLWSNRAPASRLRHFFAAALARAWKEAKAAIARLPEMAAANAARAAKFAHLSLTDLQNAILSMENSDFLGWASMAKMTEYQTELNARRAAMGAL